MKYLKLSLILLSLALALTAPALAQKSSQKPKRPVKNPPQYPHILGTGEQTGQPAGAENPSATTPAAQAQQQQDLLLVKAVVSLTLEVRGLVQEMKALNVRQQAQLDMLRLTRADLRIDQYERELKTARDRLAVLEAEEQNLLLYLTPDSLNAQVATIATFDKATTMRQLKANHEARLKVVQTEKELLQQRATELATALESFRASGGDAEKRLQAAEEALRQLEAPPGQAREKEPLPEKP
ncbi:MAG TPA: hypothetical protein VFD58_16350 [Blastocatellia bacterium]|nr:hypothetical protein [Blastocatellia bacterium]